jgi:hypothetical protein
MLGSIPVQLDLEPVLLQNPIVLLLEKRRLFSGHHGPDDPLRYDPFK